jgi:hypothetical protein
MSCVYGWQWVTHEQVPESFTVSVVAMTAFPFAVTDKVLRAEPYKTLASFARVLPAIAARTQAVPRVGWRSSRLPGDRTPWPRP